MSRMRPNLQYSTLTAPVRPKLRGVLFSGVVTESAARRIAELKDVRQPCGCMNFDSRYHQHRNPGLIERSLVKPRVPPSQKGALEYEAPFKWVSQGQQHHLTDIPCEGHNQYQLLSKDDAIFRATTAKAPCIEQLIKDPNSSFLSWYETAPFVAYESLSRGLR